MRVLICWHESCELIGIYVFIDITFQLMHGLKCMSRHVHIALIYMYHGDRQWHIALHLCASTSHEMGLSAWENQHCVWC